MTIYDVSVPLAATTPTYTGDPGIEITSWMTLGEGDPANVSLLHFGAHSGTHVDAPAHFIAGAAGVISLPLDVLIGSAVVIDVPPELMSINAEFVSRRVVPGDERVLFKTRNSGFWSNPTEGFRTDYTYLEPAAAAKLVEMNVRLVGIDYLSVEQFDSKSFATHHRLLANGIIIVEGLDLRAVTPGRYELICLPLKIADGSGDGAPARVVLRSL